MKKLLCVFLFWSGIAFGCSTPSSTYTYVSGNTILPNQVQTNENNLYSYVQTGVCQYQAGSINSAAISNTAGILYSQLTLGNSILPTDINTSTTTSVYQFENLLLPSTGTISLRSSTGTEGQVITTDGTTPEWGSIPYIKITNTQAQNTAGGTATSGSWTVIPVNTTDQDTGSNVVSNSGGTFVLAAGTYDIEAFQQFHQIGSGQIRLENTTGSTLVLTGDSILTNVSTVSVPSTLSGRFTVAAAQSLQLQYQVNSTKAGDGLGVAANFGSEVYTEIVLKKVG